MRPTIFRTFYIGNKIYISELNKIYIEISNEMRKLRNYQNYLEDRMKHLKKKP